MLESETEIRFELPFESFIGNICYVGINTFEKWTTSHHFHDHFEMCYLDDGKMLYHIDNCLHEVCQGGVFITKPGERHIGLAGGNSRFRLYYIGFKLEQLRSLEAEYYNIGISRVIKDNEGQVKRLFDHIIEEIRNKRQSIPTCTTMVHGLFLQLLASVLRLYDASTLHTANKPKSLKEPIVKLMDYLHSEIRYDHNIEEIAESLHISRSHLAREFKLATGTSIGAYMRNLCLEKAKFQLRETEKSISNIAEDLCFTSVNTFSIFFKHQTGVSPSEYRKKFNDK